MALNVKTQLLENFKNMNETEQEKALQKMSIEEQDVLIEAGYKFSVHSGKTEIEHNPYERG